MLVQATEDIMYEPWDEWSIDDSRGRENTVENVEWLEMVDHIAWGIMEEGQTGIHGTQT